MDTQNQTQPEVASVATISPTTQTQPAEVATVVSTKATRRNYVIPDGEFTTNTIRDLNGVTYVTAAKKVNDLVKTGQLTVLRNQMMSARGKPSRVFVKV